MGGELFKAITYGHAICYENPLYNQDGFVMCGGDGVSRGKALPLGRSEPAMFILEVGASAQFLWVSSPPPWHCFAGADGDGGGWQLEVLWSPLQCPPRAGCLLSS